MIIAVHKNPIGSAHRMQYVSPMMTMTMTTMMINKKKVQAMMTDEVVTLSNQSDVVVSRSLMVIRLHLQNHMSRLF